MIIACAGDQSKWNGHLGVPSHLVPVPVGAGGSTEPLLRRTVRQALTLTEDVWVTGPPDERYDIPGASRHWPGEHPNEYASSRVLWDDEERTVLLLGDVYFTDAAITTIARHTEQAYRVFGRRGASRITGTPYGEIFAASWWPEQHLELDRHLARIGDMTKAGWRLLRAMQGTPLDRHIVKRGRFFTQIDDLTDDIDFPDDYARHPAFGGSNGHPG